MAAGFIAQTDAGELLFDVNNIVYGLRRSGFMSLVASWYRYDYRSANLNPNDPSSYARTAAFDRIYGFSVTGVIAPIVFINGVGVYVGSSTVSGVTTFFFMGANASTRFYYYDTMRNNGASAGMKVFKDDAANTLVFNSEQIPLDIVGAYTAPLPPSPVPGATPSDYVFNVFNGGSILFYRNTTNTADAALLMCRSFVSLPTGNYAVSTSFSRSFVQGIMDSGPSTLPGYNPARTGSMVGMDGAYGAANGFWWTTCDSPYAYMNWNTNYGSGGFYNIPTNRLPQALVIRIDSLPFPYDVT